METALPDLEALAQEAATFLKGLTPREDRALLVTLSGDLGAGKTTFVQAVAKALGVLEHVTSPTFVLAKIYALSNQPFERLVHIDAYRLKDGEELNSIKFEEAMFDPGNLVLLEWPERVADALPPADIAITLQALPDQSRTITYA